MRKTRLLLLLLILALVMTSIVACKPDENEENPGETCTEHVDLNDDGKCEFCQADIPCTEHVDEDKDGKCDKSYCGADVPVPCETHLDSTLDGKCDICGETYTTITVAEALELCGESGNITTDRYYVRATVKTVSNVSFGEMTLVDDSGEIYVYGTYSHDGVDTFPNIESTPQRGDEVVLHCILQNYNGTKEVKNARLVGFKHVEADISEYTEMSVADAREAEAGELIILEGVVARITYANGHKPSGVILVDDSGSIYVYGADVAGSAQIGNKIKVAGVKDFWILDSEKNNAEKFDYKGCNQLSDAFTLENDGGNHEFDKSWITETTVKEIMDTPASNDITTKLFKVNALIKKAPGSGFVNYYINDIDGYTGSYCYSQCNGSDFAWLDEFDGKICTVYLTALNAKSTNSGCNWRFLPVLVIDEGYKFDLKDTAEFVVKYHALDQFLASYAWNSAASPSFDLVSSVNSELLGFEGATISYASSDTNAIKFETVDGVTKMKLVGFGTVTVTITGTYGESSYSEEITIVSSESSDIPSISVSEAIAASKGTEVIVKGIVGPSLVNKTGFYLIDESGVIAVTGPETIFEGLSIGNEVVLKGIRNINIKAETTHAIGQTYISDVEILANDYGAHDYNTDNFVTDKSLTDIYNLDALVDYSTTVFITTATVTVEETTYYTNIYLSSNGTNLRLYCSSASQYNWLKAYANQEITVEVAACNWNDKSYYTGCVLSVINEDGTKTYNTYNFN